VAVIASLGKDRLNIAGKIDVLGGRWRQGGGLALVTGRLGCQTSAKPCQKQEKSR
jgi:hypothetical protein